MNLKLVIPLKYMGHCIGFHFHWDTLYMFGFQDKLYDLDKSWENNLVFYGINSIRDEEDRPLLLENRVREILRYAE